MIDQERKDFEAWCAEQGVDASYWLSEASAGYANSRTCDYWTGWQARAALAQQAVPEGFALVPLRMNKAMQCITEQEDWTWEDLLAAAEAITEDQYTEIAAAPAAPKAGPNGMAAAVERVMDHRAHWRTAIVMMRDFGHLLAGKDGDADHTDWELVRKDFESALDALAAAPQASQASAHDDEELTKALEERDAASDYIDALLDEVLGNDRHEWTSNYGHADAMAEVRERMAFLLTQAAPQAEQQAAQLRAEVQRLKFELQNSREAWVALSEHAKNLQAALAAKQAAPQAEQQAEPDQAALAVVRHFERMVGDYNCLFTEYQGKVMPDHIYQRFVALRESRIPTARNELVAMVSKALAAQQAEREPIDMVLHCPKCGMQHIDRRNTPEDGADWNDPEIAWLNPPHRSHLCHGCGHIWRPADVPTNGVQAVKTKGKADSPVMQQAEREPLTDEQVESAAACRYCFGPGAIQTFRDGVRFAERAHGIGHHVPGQHQGG